MTIKEIIGWGVLLLTILLLFWIALWMGGFV